MPRGLDNKDEAVEPEALSLPRVDTDEQDCEKTVSEDQVILLKQFEGRRRRANVGVVEVLLQVWQAGLDVRGHRPIWVVVGKCERRLHLCFFLSAFD
jgi:hypothetical protein